MKFDLDAVNKLVAPDYFTPRQFDVLRLKLLGYTHQQIADELYISPPTVDARMQNIRQILGIIPRQKKGVRELVAWAIENGLIEVHL